MAQRPPIVEPPRHVNENIPATVIARLALALGLAIVVVGFYLKWFGAVAVAGLALTVGFWKYRKSGGLWGAISFVGVFVCLAGLIALLVQAVARATE
jgi:hypothetical protein